jgi:hypothetical protein
MDNKEGFSGGSLVLAFVTFIIGFLVGLLAFVLMPINSDYTTVGILIFMFGLMSGVLAAMLARIIVRSTRLRKSQNS